MDWSCDERTQSCLRLRTQGNEINERTACIYTNTLATFHSYSLSQSTFAFVCFFFPFPFLLHLLRKSVFSFPLFLLHCVLSLFITIRAYITHHNFIIMIILKVQTVHVYLHAYQHNVFFFFFFYTFLYFPTHHATITYCLRMQNVIPHPLKKNGNHKQANTTTIFKLEPWKVRRST